MAGAIYKGSLDDSAPILKRYLGNNSATISIGDWVAKGTAGEVILGTTGARLVGVVIGFEKKDGSAFTDDEYDSGTIDTITMDSDNQTDEYYYCVVDINPKSLWSCAGDAALGTTTGSDKANNYIDIADEYQIDESSVKTDGTICQLYSHGVDPNNSSNLLVNIVESALYG